MAEDLTKHDKKELKRKDREQEHQQIHEIKHNKELKSKITKYTVSAVIILLIVLGGYYFIIKPISGVKPYYSGFYHWHANFDISVCGKKIDVKCSSPMCGPMNLHHHNDNIIHMEGNGIAKKENLAIGKFFDGVGINFDQEQILNKKNGDLCGESPGSVKLYVNGKENNEFRNFVPAACNAQSSSEIRQSCDKIEIKFE